jgi:hypothetical protein
LQGRREELPGDSELPDRTRQALATLSKPVTRLLRRLAVDLFGTPTPRQRELLAIAVVDVPYAIVRRHLRQGTSPATRRELVAGTVRALLTATPGGDPVPGRRPGPGRRLRRGR